MIGLNCNNLCKKYDKKSVVNGVNLEVETGKIIWHGQRHARKVFYAQVKEQEDLLMYPPIM